MQTRNRIVKTLPFLIPGILLVIAAIVVFMKPWSSGPDISDIDWQVTVTGSDGQQVTLDYADIREMEPYQGYGGSVSSVGTVSGPFSVEGIPMMDICDLVGGIHETDILFISAVDGYSMVYSYEQVVLGDFDTLDPDSMKTVTYDDLDLILMYELDGEMLTEYDGRPLRMATAGSEAYLTEGHYWVKWVKNIEIKTLE